jgi:hypothetical protein
MIELAGRLLRWVVRFIGGSTLTRLLLLSLTLLSVGTGLIAIVGHIRPAWLPATIVYAVLVGWLLGRSRLPGWICGLLIVFIGMVWLALSVGQLSIPLDLFLAALPPFLRSILLRFPTDIGSLLVAWAMFSQNLLGLADRLRLWLHNFGTSTIIVDPGITSLVWGLALWLVSGWAAWIYRRRAALGLALLPATVLLIYNVYYTNSKDGLLWLVLTGGGWIVLQGLDSYMKARHRWQARQLGQTEIEPLLASVTLLLAAGLMLAGGLLPSVSIKSISTTFQHIFQSTPNHNVAESLGLQQTPAVFLHTGSAGIGLSDTHGIGPGPQLSQQVLMYVSVAGYVPPPPPSAAEHANPVAPELSYYWRSQTYDTYNGHVWIANTAQTLSLAANSPYHPDLKTLPGTDQLVTQSVTRLQPMDGAIFVAGDLLSVDHTSVGAWRTPGDLVDARTNSNTFTARSIIPFVTAAQLRSTGGKYPASVQNYLSLPDELPGRVRNLAIRLTINQPSPYDQVMAIQAYMRQFPYSLQVPGSPDNRDVADYFLFDLQKGYCDYFATTMAVMVRAAGIPARLVTGFSTGSYDYQNGRFVVVQANAHSWVEVYFPGIGWVEFEPTPNMPPFPRPGEAANAATPLGVPTPIPAPKSGAAPINWSVLRPVFVVLEWLLAITGLLLLLWRLLPFESWLLHLQAPEPAITTIQQRLYRQGRLWGVAADAARTPHEFNTALSGRLEHFTARPRLAPTVTALQADLDWLTSLYTRLLFSPHPPTPEEHHQAVRTWLRLRQSLRRLRYS